MTRSDYYLGATLEFEFLIFINCRMWDRLLLKQKIPGERGGARALHLVIFA
jgi:hypothetical protein